MSYFKNCILFVLVLLLGSLSSCDNEVCKENMYTPVSISLYFRESPSMAYALDTFSLYKVSNGSLAEVGYTDTAGVSVLKLTLDPNSTESRFFLKSDALRDTIIIRHSNTSEFVSAECGARTIFHIDTLYFAGGHAEDSISIANPLVNGVYDAQNVKIYLE